MYDYPLITKTWPVWGYKWYPDKVLVHSIPDMSIIVGMIDVWIIVHQIIEDWNVEAEKYEREIDEISNEDARVRAFGEAFFNIRPRYIQCLFSYITFFLMLENGYNLIYHQLKEFNRKNNLRIKPSKKTKRTDYIQKVVTVRNHSIAHWADPTQQDPINARAGLYWSLSCSVPNIRTMQFGTGNVAHAKPRDLGSIPDIHQECLGYLKEFDRVCADFLKAVKTTLPLTEDGWEYTDIDLWKPVAPDGTRLSEITD